MVWLLMCLTEGTRLPVYEMCAAPLATSSVLNRRRWFALAKQLKVL